MPIILMRCPGELLRGSMITPLLASGWMRRGRYPEGGYPTYFIIADRKPRATLPFRLVPRKSRSVYGMDCEIHRIAFFGKPETPDFRALQGRADVGDSGIFRSTTDL